MLLRSPLSLQLFQKIFVAYSLVTLFLTAVEVTTLFQQARITVTQELSQLGESFRIPLQFALWELNKKGLSSTGDAISSQYIVTGVHIQSETQETLYQHNRGSPKNYLWLKPIIQEIKLSYRERPLGTLRLYSDPKIIWDRVQVHLLVFSVSSIIKIIVLTFLFFWVIRHSLAKPLSRLTQQVDQTRIENLPQVEEEPALPAPPPKNTSELEILTQHFFVLKQRLGYSKYQWDHLNSKLEQQVEERTASLSQALEDLNQAQKQIVEREKMASMGKVVAGLAHEVNTPLGVSVTASSHLETQVQQMTRLMSQSQMKKSDLDQFLKTVQFSSELISRNLERMSVLIQSFKQLSVESSNYLRRNVELCACLREILQTLSPELNKTQLNYKIIGDEKLRLNGFPGVMAQIVINLVLNSIQHGFDDGEIGELLFEVSQEKERIQLCYSDNGKGATAEVLQQMYEPFFTTKLNEGGTGLGMHIVYNLVHQNLNGSMTCHSKLGAGIHFTLNFPKNSP